MYHAVLKDNNLPCSYKLIICHAVLKSNNTCFWASGPLLAIAVNSLSRSTSMLLDRDSLWMDIFIWTAYERILLGVGNTNWIQFLKHLFGVKRIQFKTIVRKGHNKGQEKYVNRFTFDQLYYFLHFSLVSPLYFWPCFQLQWHHSEKSSPK